MGYPPPPLQEPLACIPAPPQQTGSSEEEEEEEEDWIFEEDRKVKQAASAGDPRHPDDILQIPWEQPPPRNLPPSSCLGGGRLDRIEFGGLGCKGELPTCQRATPTPIPGGEGGPPLESLLGLLSLGTMV